MIIKGSLLWITSFVVALFLSGISAIVYYGILLQYLFIMTLLCFMCYKHLSYKELYILSGAKWLDNLIK